MMKSALNKLLYIVSASLLLAGCTNTFNNSTPKRVPQNPSGIYTISFTGRPATTNIVSGTTKAYITIDGKTHTMRQSRKDNEIYQYDYVMPSNSTEARYYFTFKYLVDVNGAERPREVHSKIFPFELTNKYVIGMQYERGPVGTEIPIVGRGFKETDRIMIGKYQAETRFMSDVAISFFVPPIPAYESYDVVLKSGSEDIDVGEFHVDPSVFRVTPSSIEISSGEQTIILFAIQEPAPAGGLPIDVTTDIPASIIMPEIIIPEDARTVRVPLKGGSADKGNLFIKAPGFTEIEIPVNITEAEAINSAIEVPVPEEVKEEAADLILEE